MKAEIITIGDEILIGQIVDTNAAYIAQRLNSAGFVVSERSSVGDRAEQTMAMFASTSPSYLPPPHTVLCEPISFDIISKAVFL